MKPLFLVILITFLLFVMHGISWWFAKKASAAFMSWLIKRRSAVSASGDSK